MSSMQPRPYDEGQRVADPTSVYRYYDRNGVLIYVGITRQGMGRNVQHNGKAEWWPFVARQDVDHLPSRPAAAKREKELIREFRPPFNKQHNPWHDEVRSAYLEFAACQVPEESAYDQYLRLGKLLPLDVVECDSESGLLTMRTRLEHASLATALRLVKPQLPIRAGRKVGVVTHIKVMGAFAYLRCEGNKHLPADITPVRALVGWHQVDKPHYPFLRQILAAQDAVPMIAQMAVRP